MIDVTIKGHSLVFEADGASRFSPHRIDKGTLALLSAVEFTEDDKVLDLGCGYGVVGILAAKFAGAENVVMTDINRTALKLAEGNARRNDVPGVTIVRSDGFHELTETGFTWILSNPPYHVDFNIPKHFIEKGFNRLALGGRMAMVTKRREWYRNKLRAIFGGVTIREIDGYLVFIAEKRGMNYANVKS